MVLSFHADVIGFLFDPQCDKYQDYFDPAIRSLNIENVVSSLKAGMGVGDYGPTLFSNQHLQKILFPTCVGGRI
jgi:hypothetical protein